MKKLRTFCPTEIIFSATSICNLRCEHCFTNKNPNFLSSKDAVSFLKNAKNFSIEKIGFSGGEPFLNLDFLLDVIKFAYDENFSFDRIMTNGVWWKDENELKSTLTKIYDAGFDGKFGLSYDNFHNQNFEKIFVFIKNVLEIFGRFSVEIQSVVSEKDLQNDFESNFNLLAEKLNSKITKKTDKNRKGFYLIEGNGLFIPVFRTIQTFESEMNCAWQSKKWFKEDYCEGPGQILFVHADKNIAPCCGFANENPELFIGKITDNIETVLQNAQKNEIVQICYNSGLLKQAKLMEKNKILSKKRTDDPCTFCDYLCKQKRK